MDVLTPLWRSLLTAWGALCSRADEAAAHFVLAAACGLMLAGACLCGRRAALWMVPQDDDEEEFRQVTRGRHGREACAECGVKDATEYCIASSRRPSCECCNNCAHSAMEMGNRGG